MSGARRHPYVFGIVSVGSVASTRGADRSSAARTVAKPVDPCCNFETDAAHWTESLPWRPSPLCSSQPCATRCDRPAAFGCQRIKSQFRSLDRCGCIATRKACRQGNYEILGCVHCERRYCDDVALVSCAPKRCCSCSDEDNNSNTLCSDCWSDSDLSVIDSLGVPWRSAFNDRHSDLSRSDDGAASDVDWSIDVGSVESLDEKTLRQWEERVDDSENNAGVDENLGSDTSDSSSVDFIDANRFRRASSCFDSLSTLDTFGRHCCKSTAGCVGDCNAATFEQRASRRRRAFRPNQTLLATPSGQKQPISETMSGGARYRVQLSPQVRTAQLHRANVRAPSKFVGGDPNEFCLSTTCRFAGSSTGGPVEKRAAVCALR